MGKVPKNKIEIWKKQLLNDDKLSEGKYNGLLQWYWRRILKISVTKRYIPSCTQIMKDDLKNSNFKDNL